PVGRRQGNQQIAQQQRARAREGGDQGRAPQARQDQAGQQDRQGQADADRMPELGARIEPEQAIGQGDRDQGRCQPGGQEGDELDPIGGQRQQRQEQDDCADAADPAQAARDGGIQAGLEQHGEELDRQNVMKQDGQLADPGQGVGRDDGAQERAVPPPRPGAQAQAAEDPAGQHQIGRLAHGQGDDGQEGGQGQQAAFEQADGLGGVRGGAGQRRARPLLDGQPGRYGQIQPAQNLIGRRGMRQAHLLPEQAVLNRERRQGLSGRGQP